MTLRKTERQLRRDGDKAYEAYRRQLPVARFSLSRLSFSSGNVLKVLRYATAIILAITLISGGGILLYWRSVDGSAVLAFDFGVVAYAESADGQRVDQEITETSVALPSGRLYQGKGYTSGNADQLETTYDVHWQVGNLVVDGEDIAAVIYESERGGFAKYSDFNIHPVANMNGVIVYNYISHYSIDKTTYEQLLPIVNFWSDPNSEIYGIVESGGLDGIIGSNLRQAMLASSDIFKYAMRVTRIDSEGHDELDDSVLFDASLPLRYELLVKDYSAEQDFVDSYDYLAGSFYDPESIPQSWLYWEHGQQVTMRPGGAVNYCPTFAMLDQVARAQDGIDFESFGIDTVRITAVSASGEAVVKTVEMSFDANGALCASIVSTETVPAGDVPEIAAFDDDPVPLLALDTKPLLSEQVPRSAEAAEAYRGILAGSESFYDPMKGEDYTLAEWFGIYYDSSNALREPTDPEVVPKLISIVAADLDDDGIPEIIIGWQPSSMEKPRQLDWAENFLILHYYDGQVSGVSTVLRGFNGLRVNGVIANHERETIPLYPEVRLRFIDDISSGRPYEYEYYFGGPYASDVPYARWHEYTLQNVTRLLNELGG